MIAGVSSEDAPDALNASVRLRRFNDFLKMVGRGRSLDELRTNMGDVSLPSLEILNSIDRRDLPRLKSLYQDGHRIGSYKSIVMELAVRRGHVDTVLFLMADKRSHNMGSSGWVGWMSIMALQQGTPFLFEAVLSNAVGPYQTFEQWVQTNDDSVESTARKASGVRQWYLYRDEFNLTYLFYWCLRQRNQDLAAHLETKYGAHIDLDNFFWLMARHGDIAPRTEFDLAWFKTAAASMWYMKHAPDRQRLLRGLRTATGPVR